MMSLMHRVQLDLSGADISFTAPLSLSANLNQGAVLVSDMFKLYRFENMLYRMNLSGEEMKAYLEFAAGLWFNTMNGPGDHLLLLREEGSGRLANPSFNCSSAAGIDYTIDVSQEAGERVPIRGFTDGSSFEINETYNVPINSHRGNGGGGHLTRGAGIPKEALTDRVNWSTDIDLRYYLMDHLMKQDTLEPILMDNWEVIPSPWVRSASRSDNKLF